uniref:FAD-binding protein n=1 Tax=Hassallia byssoidea TaxID=482630 RepID=UPI001912DE31|nr:FAD-binding protein [Hassalia byssoidea]
MRCLTTSPSAWCRAGTLGNPDAALLHRSFVYAPPYYAMQLMPLLYNTQGGPRRDKQARVLDPDGNLIPRLYAAGEFGSIWGFRYQTSTNVW